jgi:hypothetical protein
VVLDLVLIGLAMAFYPVALTVFILILASKNGPRKGAGFIFGWLATLAVLAVATILAIAERQRRKLGQPRQRKEPKWQSRVDDMSALFAIGLGAFFQPSVFVISAVATITGAKLSSAAGYFCLVLFGLLSVSTYLTMDIYAVVRPERSDEVLSSLKAWIDRHTDVIIIVVAAAVGLWLVGKSSYLLAT